MKKLISLIIFVGLAINVSGQEEPKNLKEAMDAAQARWLIGNWESENADGQKSQKQYKWGIEDSVILVHSKTTNEYHGVIGFDGGRNNVVADTKTTNEYHGVIGFDGGKVVGKYFGNNVVADTEWSGGDNGKLIEIVKMRGVNNDGEPTEFSYGPMNTIFFFK
jgi:hypothetical protein